MSAGVTRSGDDVAQRVAAAPAGRHQRHSCFVGKTPFCFCLATRTPSDTPTVGAAHPAGRLQAGRFILDLTDASCAETSAIFIVCLLVPLQQGALLQQNLKKNSPLLKQQHNLLLRISLFHIKCTKQTQYLLSTAFNLCHKASDCSAIIHLQPHLIFSVIRAPNSRGGAS